MPLEIRMGIGGRIWTASVFALIACGGGEDDTGTPVDTETDEITSGDWGQDPCFDEVASDGHLVGQNTTNFELTDQYGDTVRLHDYCERTVLLVSSAVWCAPCRDEAPIIGGWYDELKEDGLMVITLLTETVDQKPPEVSDLKAWADKYGLTHPVVSDVDWEVTYRFTSGTDTTLPTSHLIGPDAEVLMRDNHIEKSDLIAFLP
jgi:peroxiredoxin